MVRKAVLVGFVCAGSAFAYGCSSKASRITHPVPPPTSAAAAAAGSPTSSSNKAAPTTTVPPVAHVGSTLAYGALRITLAKVLDPEPTKQYAGTPDAGTRYVALQFSMTNTGSAVVTGNINTDVSLKGSDNQTYTTNIGADVSMSSCTNFASGTYNVAQGETSVGCVGFQLPTGVSPAEASYTPEAGFSNKSAVWEIP
jgi:hypothetical protein